MTPNRVENIAALRRPTPDPSTILIRGGYVTSLDASIGDLPGGDVLIDGDTIKAVGHDLDAPGASVVDASGKIVIPGLIDAHRHVWQGAIGGAMSHAGGFGTALAELSGGYRPEDVYAGVLWGALRAIEAGITTVADWSHVVTTPAHADENVRALRDSGIRGLFLYGPPIGADVMKWFVESTVRHPADAGRMRSEVLADDAARVTMGLALRGPDFSTPEVTASDFRLARELGVPISIHAGLPAYLARPRTVETLDRLRVLGPDLHFAHGSQFTGADLDRIAASGGSVVPCPTADLSVAARTGRYPVTGRAIAHGLLPALGTDTAADAFTEMRTARAAERDRATQPVDADETVHLTPRDMLRLATAAGAAALGLGDRVGTISPGKRADLVVLDAGRSGVSAPALVLESTPADVDTVIVDGTILKRDGRLLGLAEDRARDLVEAARRRLFASTSLLAG